MSRQGWFGRKSSPESQSNLPGLGAARAHGLRALGYSFFIVPQTGPHGTLGDDSPPRTLSLRAWVNGNSIVSQTAPRKKIHISC